MADTSDLAQIQERAVAIGDACHWRAEQHLVSETRWRHRARWIAFWSAFITALGGATALAGALADSTGLAGTGAAVTLIAAAITAYESGLKPAAEAEQHRRASAGFGDIRARCRNLATAEPNVVAAREELQHLTEKQGELEIDAPAVEHTTREAIGPAIKHWREEVEKHGRDEVGPPEDMTPIDSEQLLLALRKPFLRTPFVWRPTLRVGRTSEERDS